MDRKAGCVIVQPTVPETAVSTLDFVSEETDQLPVSAAFLMSCIDHPELYSLQSVGLLSSNGI